MATYLIRRLLIAIPSLLGISVILFTILALAPGDPFDGDEPERAARGARGHPRQLRPQRPDHGPLSALAFEHGAGRLGLLLRQPHQCRR
jgi:ABC-type dipeptide/oligopeptide/nickel transport system permease component